MCVAVVRIVGRVETVVDMAFDDVLFVGSPVLEEVNEDVLPVVVVWLVGVGVAVAVGVGELVVGSCVLASGVTVVTSTLVDEDIEESDMEGSEIASGSVAVVDIVAAVSVGLAVAIDVVVGHGKSACQVSIVNMARCRRR